MWCANLRALRTAAVAAPGKQYQQLRFLNIHEYQSAELMKSFGVNVPPGIACKTVDEIKEATKTIGGDEV